MDTGLILIDNQLHYVERPIEVTGMNRKTKSFSIYIDQIKIIAVTAIVLLDDEDFLISIIDNTGREFKFSSLEFETEAAIALSNHFNLNSFSKLWGIFTYGEHYRGESRILFPEELQNEKLYQKVFESKHAFSNSIKRLLGNGNIYDRTLRNEILNLLHLRGF